VDVSPARMLVHLVNKVEQQASYASPYGVRYDGKHVVPHVAQMFKDVFSDRVSLRDEIDGELDPVGIQMLSLQPPRSGLASVGIDSVAERVLLDALVTGDERADEILAETVARSDLRAQVTVGLREALISGRASLLTWSSPDDGLPVVSVETPDQVAVHLRREPPRLTDAAVKVTKDEWSSTGRRRAWFWTDEGVRYDLVETDASRRVDGVDMRWQEVGRVASLPTPPIVELADVRRARDEPASELARIETLLDSHQVLLGLLVLGLRFGAVPIRTASKLPVERDEDGNPKLGPDGKPRMPFDYRSDKLWASTTDTDWGTLAPSDLSTIINGIETVTREVRATLALPPWSVGADLAGGWTGETIKASEVPLVRRVQSITETWLPARLRTVSDHVLHLAGRPEVRPGQVRVAFADPETRLEAQAVDAAAKIAALPSSPLVPLLLRRIGWSEAEVQAGTAAIEASAREDEDVAAALPAA
jgi:hypothetical protein